MRCHLSRRLSSGWVNIHRPDRQAPGSRSAAIKEQKKARGRPRSEEDRRHPNRHRRHRPDRVEETGRREWHPDAVEHDREADVLHHLAIAPSAHLARCHHRLEAIVQDEIVQDDDVGRIDRDVGAAPIAMPTPFA